MRPITTAHPARPTSPLERAVHHPQRHLPSTAPQVVPGDEQVPPQVGNGSPPEQCSTQMHALLPRVVQVSYGLPPAHDPSHTGAPLPPLQNGGTHVSGKPGTGPTHVQPSGHSPPQGGGGGSLAHAQ